MNDLIIPVNNEALSRALLAVAGEAMTKTIIDAYKVIDLAMVFGYERSQAEEAGKREALAKEDRDEGLSVAEEENVYNDGYVDGVSDARLWPEYADQRVAELCGEDRFDDFRDVKYFAGDSGDENDAIHPYDDGGDSYQH